MEKKITLKDLPNVTAQEVFDQIALHLLKQNAKSVDEVRCLYRGEGGYTCAAGCMIGDDEYNKDMEGKSWEVLIERRLVPEAHSRLIIELQQVHDTYPIDVWPETLGEVALMFQLSGEVVKNFRP